MRFCRFALLVVLLLLLSAGAARADLPDLPRQELWVKIVSALAGIAVVFALTSLGLSRILYGPLGMEAEMATRMSIIVGVILSFLWFAYLFGQILNTTIIIALGALGVIGGIVAIMKNSPPL